MIQLRTTTLRSSRASLGTLAWVLAAVAGCSDTTTTAAIQLNLDRPVDVAFACYGGLRDTGGATVGKESDPVVVSAQPLASCEIRSNAPTSVLPPPATIPPGQEDLTTLGGPVIPPVNYFGLILQSGPGTVAIAQFPAEPASTFSLNEVTIRDADPLTPGKNSIAVGVRPVAIATDRAGCFAITANAGSCDLSTLDVNSALALDGLSKVARLVVKNAAGTPIEAQPAAMVAEPGTSTIGQICPATPSGVVYVAYPSCHLVAAVDLATEKVVAGVSFATDGTASLLAGSALQNVTCPKECGGTATATPGPQPSTIDLVGDARIYVGKPAATRRLAIGSRNRPEVTIIELDPTTSLPRPVPAVKVALLEPAPGKLGVLDLALSPQIGMGNPTVAKEIEPDSGALSSQFQFVYAVTTDGTVRVADVLQQNRECDTQIDPRYLRTETNPFTLACLPMATPAMPRRTGAIGPGIPVPADGVAAAVNIVRSSGVVSDTRAIGPSRLVGTFGVISSTTGATYLVDLDDDDRADAEVMGMPLAVDLATTLPHQLRDAVAGRNEVAVSSTDASPICNTSGPILDADGGLRGGIRLAGLLNRLTLPEVIANSKASMLPSVRQVLCTGSDATIPVSELAFAAQSPTLPREQIREDRFPDTQAMHATEDWRLVWEGSLSGDSASQGLDGPAIRLGTVTVAGPTLKITDRSRPFCAVGVEKYDQVQLRGCDAASTTNQCPLGTRCYLHPEAVNGIGACLPTKTADSLADTCRDFLVSIRRYTVGTAKSGELTLLPRRRELRTTPLTGCIDNAQCKTLADYEAKQPTELQPGEDTAVNPRTFACLADDARKGNLKRCTMTCTKDSDCDGASACDNGVCMEGVIPPAECIAGVQRYETRASEAFTVLGSLTGYLHPFIANPGDPAGECIKDPNASPLLIGRIPLTAPPCTGTEPNLTPNPCSKTVTQTETVAKYDPLTCAALDPATAVETRNAEAIFFRNPALNFHLVDPTYPGDHKCRGDRGGPLGVPLVGVPNTFTGLAFTWRLIAGYTPFALRTSAVVPVRVLRGPQQSIWVVDEGDYLSESTSLPSTRGKVFRIESSSLNIVNVMQ